MKIIIFLVLIVLFVSCTINTGTKTSSIKSTTVDKLKFFADSINFGQKQNNKIEIYEIETEENTIAKVVLYEKRSSQWKLIDSLTFYAALIYDLDAEVKDFNIDNFNDIIFTTGMSARGGNIVQTLILYAPKDKSLNLIKNSEEFPNLEYNEKLNCIDACILTGGQTTYFLKIENDSLKEFAEVDQRDGRIIAKILETNGKWKEIENIKDTPEGFDRFINYNPIEKRK